MFVWDNRKSHLFLAFENSSNPQNPRSSARVFGFAFAFLAASSQ